MHVFSTLIYQGIKMNIREEKHTIDLPVNIIALVPWNKIPSKDVIAKKSMKQDQMFLRGW